MVNLIKFAEFCKIWQLLTKHLDYRAVQRIPKAVQRSALCRSRRELSNAYLLAKFGLDTAENEPCQVCPTPRNAAASPRRGRVERGDVELLLDRVEAQAPEQALAAAVERVLHVGALDLTAGGRVIFQATNLPTSCSCNVCFLFFHAMFPR